MEKSQSQRPMPVAEMTPKEFESTGKSARMRRALNNMMEDFEGANRNGANRRKQSRCIIIII